MTHDEYADLVLQLVKTDLDPRTHQVTLALLGDRLKSMGSEREWKTLGFRSLLTFVEHLQSQGRIEVVKTVKGAWAIELALGEAAPSAAQAPARFVPLLRQVWWAFVLPEPAGRRFINRADGDVRLGLQGPPGASADWVEVDQISEAAQKEWAATFLEENPVSNLAEARDALASSMWHRDFPEALAQSSAEIRARWNRVRSKRISTLVEQWRVEHDVPREHIFQGQEPSRSSGKVDGSGESTAHVLMDQRRKIVMMALNSLSTERLMEIPIPASAIFDAIDASATKTHK